MAEPVTVRIVDTDEAVTVDGDGNVFTRQPDGGNIVSFGAANNKDAEGKGWFDNLVEQIDSKELAEIAEELYEAISADERSRDGYLATRAKGLDLCGLQLKEPKTSSADTASEGISTVTNPLLLETILKGWANAQAELLPAAGPAKVKDDGEEVDDELADALERDFNHYLTCTATEFYPETSHMLLWGPYFGGSGFKKVYRCPLKKRPTSKTVEAKDLIVDDTTKDLKSCGRITHYIPMRQSVMKRMMLSGAYRRADLPEPAPDSNAEKQKIEQVQGTSKSSRPEDQPYNVWEAQCELDLDQFIPSKGPSSQFKSEKIPLPFCVTLDKDSKEILAIRRDWGDDDENAERKRMYVKYPYVPGPGFYGTGMINILGNAAAALTMAWRIALDAGEFASFPGGLVAKLGGRQNSSLMRAGPGQFIPIETGGMPISQVVMGMPYKDPTPGLMTMIDKVLAQAKEVGGVADIPAAEGIANVPVGTMLAQIEQATKIMAAAHKGMHQAMSEELELILDLFRAHPEDFWRYNKIQGARDFWTEEKFALALQRWNLVPVSDPNVPSHIHRVAKALAEVQLASMPLFTPYFNLKEVAQSALQAIHSRIQLIDPPPQQPGTSPEDAKVAQAQADIVAAQAKAQEAQAKIALMPQQNQLEMAKIQAEQNTHAMELRQEAIIHQADMAKLAQESKQRDTEHQLTAAKTVGDLAQQQHDRQMDQQQFGLDAAQAAHQARMDIAQHVQDASQASAQHGLDVAQHLHDRQMDHAAHGLAVKQASDSATQAERDSKIKEKAANKPAAKPKAKAK